MNEAQGDKPNGQIAGDEDEDRARLNEFDQVLPGDLKFHDGKKTLVDEGQITTEDIDYE